MSNYPKWKATLVMLAVALGLLFVAPNFFGESPAIQVTPVNENVNLIEEQEVVAKALESSGILYKSITSTQDKILLQFPNTSMQAKAKDLLNADYGREFYAAMTILPSTPSWMEKWGLKPVTKGLDLRGGVHLLLQVDTKHLVANLAESNLNDIQAVLTDENIEYTNIDSLDNAGISVELASAEDMTRLQNAIYAANPELTRVVDPTNDRRLNLLVTESEINALKSRAVEQNSTTLRTRMNSVGVAEPSITREGSDRIVVQLPGLSDPKDAIDALSSTASLEYYLVDEEAMRSGQRAFGVKFVDDKDGNPVALKRKMILSGDHIIDASSGLDQTTGGPMVSVVLDSVGASKMAEVTHANLQKPMAVVFIEYMPVTVQNEKGELVTEVEKKEEVISVATIQSEFSKRFQTTGLDSIEEARSLARSLRSGALIAPVYVIEERTIGPSAGEQNIKQGMRAIVLGFVLVMVFMVFYYRKFGVVSVCSLLLNVVFMIALLSVLGATLTLPGIAGIVLTMGMAVDANVLIYERIREELRNKKSPKEAINLGFQNALSTITDANLTTLIAAIMLFSYGTGPIKGFAVTLAIGIATSMFTAIVVTRFIIHLWVSKKRNLSTLSI